MSNIGRISTSMFFNNMANTTVSQESTMYGLQNQMATGKKINVPSDDPLGAASLSIIKDQAAQNGVYKNSIASAQGSIQASSTAVAAALGDVQNALQLSVQARNGSYGPTDLANIGSTLKGVLDQLVQTANGTDGQGNYLFSGSQTQTKPFQYNGASYAYSGDQTVSFARTGAATLTQTSWTGQDLFAGAFTGDGVVDATAAVGNLGNAAIGDVVQSSPGAFNGDSYSVAFTMVGTQLQATITDTTTATLVSGPNNFTSGQSLSFAGVNLTLTGTPAAGDSFTVGKASRFNVLDSLANLANALSNSSTLTKSQLQNALSSGQRDLSAAVANMTTESALMGSELNGLSIAQTSVEDRALNLEGQRSNIEDIDLAKAYSAFTAQKTSLTASLQSFATISGLSLFSYLR
jgi:flagellar hook-associated protein 3 FlgL